MKRDKRPIKAPRTRLTCNHPSDHPEAPARGAQPVRIAREPLPLAYPDVDSNGFAFDGEAW